MIKIGSFVFDEIPADNHWVTFAQFGPLRKYDIRYFDSFHDYIDFIEENSDSTVPYALLKDEVYQISFDQSTSNTGMFVKNYNNTRAFMIEVSRSKGQDADDYIFDFEMFVHEFCRQGTVSHLIYERPISNDKFRSAQVLFQLEGIIRSFTKRYKEFQASTLEFIENSSWRRVVILPTCHSTDKKAKSKESITTIFDWTNSYSHSIGKDNDIYEAMGVMFGWFMNSYDALGRPYVRGDEYSGIIGGFILPYYSAEEISTKFKELGIESTWAMQNPRKSTFSNIASAVEQHKVVCVELTDSYSMLTMCVECNIKWTDPDKITLVLVAANYVDSRIFEITGKEFHFVF